MDHTTPLVDEHRKAYTHLHAIKEQYLPDLNPFHKRSEVSEMLAINSIREEYDVLSAIIGRIEVIAFNKPGTHLHTYMFL